MRKLLVVLVCTLAAILPSQPARADLFTTKANPNAPQVVVPLFQTIGYGTAYNLGQIAQEETIRVLCKLGYNPLASAESMDLMRIQQELQLQGRNWRFADSQYVLAGTVEATNGQNYLRTNRGSGQVAELAVRVQLRPYDLGRRLAGDILQGNGSARGLSDVDIYQLTESRWDRGHGVGGFLRGLVSGMNIGRHVQVDPTRKAVAEAIEDALRGQEFGGRVVQKLDPPARKLHRTDIAASGTLTLILENGQPLRLVVDEGEVHPGDFIIFQGGPKYQVLAVDGQNLSVKAVRPGEPAGRFQIECP